MLMSKQTALEWAELIRRYVEAEGSPDAVLRADDIIGPLTDCIAMKAEREGWYQELQNIMGWEEPGNAEGTAPDAEGPLSRWDWDPFNQVWLWKKADRRSYDIRWSYWYSDKTGELTSAMFCLDPDTDPDVEEWIPGRRWNEGFFGSLEEADAYMTEYDSMRKE